MNLSLEHRFLLHGALQMNGALSAGFGAENTLQAWDAAVRRSVVLPCWFQGCWWSY